MANDLDGRELSDVIPEGTARPESIDPAIFEAALARHLSMKRLDMSALAAELGFSRATLYRRVGSRERLLGEVLWYLTRKVLARAHDRAAGLAGRERVLELVSTVIREVHGEPVLNALLDREPEAALRILTSRQGTVQQPLIGALTRAIESERQLAGYEPRFEPEKLAYLIVRIGESFLYADVIADNEPDSELALAVIDELL